MFNIDRDKEEGNTSSDFRASLPEDVLETLKAFEEGKLETINYFNEGLGNE